MSERPVKTTKERCDSMLHALLGNAHVIELWWTTPNKAFNDETPAVVFDRDDRLVYNYLVGFCSGGYY